MLSRNIRIMNLFMVRVNMLRRNIKNNESFYGQGKYVE